MWVVLTRTLPAFGFRLPEGEIMNYGRQTQEVIAMSISGITVALYFLFLFFGSLSTSLASDALTYLALILCAFGIVLFVLSIITLRRRGTKELTDQGIYGVVRHPMYLSGMFFYLAMICFLPHWIIAANAIMGMASVYWTMILGEQRNLEKFGETYERYMQSVPRMNILAGLMRQLRR
jgi:protein-S-isoprenylcysteine O-methyltransferase Ste14